MKRLLFGLVPSILNCAFASPVSQQELFSPEAFTAVQNLTAPEFIPDLDRGFDISLQFRNTPIDNYTTGSLCLHVAVDLAKGDLGLRLENQMFSLATHSSVRMRLVSPTGSILAKHLQWAVYAAFHALVRRDQPFTETAVKIKYQNVLQGYISIERNTMSVGDNSSTAALGSVKVLDDAPDEPQPSSTSLEAASPTSLQSVRLRIAVSPLSYPEWLGQDRIFVNLINAVVGLSSNVFQRYSPMRFRNRFVDVAVEIQPPYPPRPHGPYNTMKYSLLTAVRIPRDMLRSGAWVASEVTTFVEGENVGKWIVSSLAKQSWPAIGGSANQTIATF